MSLVSVRVVLSGFDRSIGAQQQDACDVIGRTKVASYSNAISAANAAQALSLSGDLVAALFMTVLGSRSNVEIRGTFSILEALCPFSLEIASVDSRARRQFRLRKFARPARVDSQISRVKSQQPANLERQSSCGERESRFVSFFMWMILQLSRAT